QRFREAAKAYPGVAKALLRAQPPEADLFSQLREAYPVVNRVQEDALRKSLEEFETLDPSAARQQIESLAKTHLPRCQWVWSDLGEAPLANALKHLHALTKAQELFAGGANFQNLADGYRKSGWLVDQAALKALAAIRHNGDAKPVCAALR